MLASVGQVGMMCTLLPFALSSDEPFSLELTETPKFTLLINSGVWTHEQKVFLSSGHDKYLPPVRILYCNREIYLTNMRKHSLMAPWLKGCPSILMTTSSCVQVCRMALKRWRLARSVLYVSRWNFSHGSCIDRAWTKKHLIHKVWCYSRWFVLKVVMMIQTSLCQSQWTI